MHREKNRLILKALVLILPICILISYAEYRLKGISNVYTRKRAALENQCESIKVLALGTSQSLYAVDPEYFSCRGFNLCNVSQSLFYDTQMTMKYIDRMKSLRCIIVSISYFSFWNQVSDGIEKWRDYYYYHFWNIEFTGLSHSDPRFYSLIMLYTPEQSFQYALHNFASDPASVGWNGWSKIDTSNSKQLISDATGKARADFHNRFLLQARFTQVYSMLDSFVFACRKRNIEVVFITTPVLPTYYNYVKPEIVNKNSKTIIALCKKYNCRYFDYFKDKRFIEEDFYDNDHLNFLGAEKFSKILDRDIVSKVCAGGS